MNNNPYYNNMGMGNNNNNMDMNNNNMDMNNNNMDMNNNNNNMGNKNKNNNKMGMNNMNMNMGNNNMGMNNNNNMGMGNNNNRMGNNNAPMAAGNPMINRAQGLNTSEILTGALIGVAATYILTNENVQKTLFKGMLSLGAVVGGGLDEMKERFEDAKAEHEANKAV